MTRHTDNTRLTNVAYGKMLVAVIAAVMMLIAMLPSAVFASENVPVTIEIPVTYEVNGNVSRAGGGTFTLTSEDSASPMPKDAKDGNAVLTIENEGTYNFGEITYTTPGEYWYKVTRDAKTSKGATIDSSEFRVKVIALNDGHGSILAYRNGSDKKSELIYRDQVTPKTGDTNNRIIYLAMAGGIAATIALFVLIRHRAKEDQEED